MVLAELELLTTHRSRVCETNPSVLSKRRKVRVTKRHIATKDRYGLDVVEEEGYIQEEKDITVHNPEPQFKVTPLAPKLPAGRRGLGLPFVIRGRVTHSPAIQSAEEFHIESRIRRILLRRGNRNLFKNRRSQIAQLQWERELSASFDKWLDEPRPHGLDYMTIENGQISMIAFKTFELSTIDADVQPVSMGVECHPDDATYARARYQRQDADGRAFLEEVVDIQEPTVLGDGEQPKLSSPHYEVLVWTRDEYFDGAPRWPRDWHSFNPAAFYHPQRVLLHPGFPGVLYEPQTASLDHILLKFLKNFYEIGPGPWVRHFRELFSVTSPALQQDPEQRRREEDPEFRAVMHAPFIIPPGWIWGLAPDIPERTYRDFTYRYINRLTRNANGGLSRDHLQNIGIPNEYCQERVRRLLDLTG